MSSIPPFDILAQTYDADFTRSNIGLLQRERVWHYLNTTLTALGSALKILEINCGTGEDALRLSDLGHTVTATDASAEMIKKAMLRSHSSKVEFLTCSFDELELIFVDRQFDLVFSNFGGLNCIDTPALKKLCADLDRLVRPGGKLFLVLMSDCCIWEMLYYSIKAKFNLAFRRWKKRVMFNINNSQQIPIYYYSPSKLKKIFGYPFKMQNKFPVGLFIPPSYLEQSFSTRKAALNKLTQLEKKIGNSFLARFADHYCSIFTKTTQA